MSELLVVAIASAFSACALAQAPTKPPPVDVPDEAARVPPPVPPGGLSPGLPAEEDKAKIQGDRNLQDKRLKKWEEIRGEQRNPPRDASERETGPRTRGSP